MTTIDRFEGEYRFMSNFYRAEVYYAGMRCKTVEHAYQAAKTRIKHLQLWIQAANTPGEAKRRGGAVPVRKDWDSEKVSVMLGLLRQKFRNPQMRVKLLATGNAMLIEGNDHNDTFWGVCKGVGHNTLGKLLMQVRDELRKQHHEVDLYYDPFLDD